MVCRFLFVAIVTQAAAAARVAAYLPHVYRYICYSRPDDETGYYPLYGLCHLFFFVMCFLTLAGVVSAGHSSKGSLNEHPSA